MLVLFSAVKSCLGCYSEINISSSNHCGATSILPASTIFFRSVFIFMFCKNKNTFLYKKSEDYAKSTGFHNFLFHFYKKNDAGSSSGSFRAQIVLKV